MDIPWDKIDAKYVVSIVQFLILIGFAKWMIGVYYKLVQDMISMKDRDNATWNKLSGLVETCLDTIEKGVKHDANDPETKATG